jgi:hypothetical protein
MAVLAGCSSSASPASSTRPGTSGGLPTRTCATGVSGALPRGWKSSSIRAGFGVDLPLGGSGGSWTHRPARRVAVQGGVAWRVQRVEDDGHRACWSPRRSPGVARSSLPWLRLAFQLPVSSPSRLADGQVADRFVPCSSGKTYFNGGLIAAGAQCARLEVGADSGSSTRGSRTGPTSLRVEKRARASVP